MRNYHNGDRDGFTLIEVMIALTVLAVGILAVVGLFTNSIKGNDMGRKVTEATSLAQNRIDELMTAAVFLNLSSNYQGTETDLTATGEDGGFYTRKTEVSRVYDADTNIMVEGLYLITVTVSWQGFEREHQVKLQSLRAQGT